jgi:hypothetical protein
MDLREQLAAAFPEQDHKLLFYKQGAKRAAYNELSVLETLKEFCSGLLKLSPFVDPRGKYIKIVEGNFPKLCGLVHATLSRDEFSASEIVSAIREGTFDLGDYDPVRDDRMRTIFCIPEVLTDPDAIYKNAHKIVIGDEVYVRVYNKMGSKVKLVFTMDIRQNGRVIRTVPITSFLTDPDTAVSYVKGVPLYRRK